MNKYKNRIVAVSAICFLFLVLGLLLYPRDTDRNEYIFDKTYDIRLSDVKQSRSALPRRNVPADQSERSGSAAGEEAIGPAEPDPGFDLKAIFSEGLINSHTTLKYFKHLEHHFRKMASISEHFEQVRQYLYARFPEDEARILFDTYQKYLQCEIDLLDEFKNFTAARSSEEALATLRRIQDFRRERLGRDLADNLFGADVKAKEYAFRRAAIVNDDTVYGEEKEKRIGELNADMWGEDAAAVEQHPNPYNRYQEKMKIYEKDLGELQSDAARQEKIRSFREAFFTPDIVEKLEGIDRQVIEEKTREQAYRLSEKEIRDAAEMDDEKKAGKIRELQDRTFGKDAESFRRREAIREGRESFIMEKEQESAGKSAP